MRANIARALAGGAEILEVTKEGPGFDYKTMTVPELIGKQNVVAKRTASSSSKGVRCFICIPELGNAFAYGYGAISSYADAIVQLETDSYGNKAEYDPETGTFTTNDRTANYYDRWVGTYKFYAW